MKKLIGIFLILLLIGCKNTVKDISSKKAIVTDTVSTTEVPKIKIVTLFKLSKPFQLNNLQCYWKNYINSGEETIFTLINSKTEEKLFNETISVRDIDLDSKSNDYFEKLNKEVFKDVNFDGFEDFVYVSVGSMAMTSMTNIFVFNKVIGQFEFSEYLSDTSIEIDPVGKKLITSSFGRDFEVTKTHYFNKSGKIKFTEVISEYSKSVDSIDFPVEYKTYEKIVNGKVVATKRDSVMYTEK